MIRLGWATFHVNDEIRCPGYQDRRSGVRGGGRDRRVMPRGPCPRIWGRVGPDAVTHVRVMVSGGLELGSTLLWCDQCHRSIEFLTVAVRRAA